MIFSIITPTYNSSIYLKDHLKSVKSQKFADIEHIFIDNKSVDSTLEILNEYKKKAKYKVKIISKKDKGIYFAFNKGLYNSRGKIITILNSDDFFARDNILNQVKKNFDISKCDFLYGDIKVVSRNNIKKQIRLWKSSRIKNNDFYKIPHPSFFISSTFVKKNNLKFNTDFKISADLEFIKKCYTCSKNYVYLNSVMVSQRSGGTSQQFINVFKANIEVYKILNLNIYEKISFIIKKIIFKICQL